MCLMTYTKVKVIRKRKLREKCTFIQYKDIKKVLLPISWICFLKSVRQLEKYFEYQSIIDKKGKKYSGLCTEKDDKYELLDVDTNEKVNINKSDVSEILETYNTFEQDVFDALQLAYKITANSLYGQIGARTSSIYLKRYCCLHYCDW